MKHSINIIPFGAHYYRVPTPKPSEWEKDFKNIKRYGFNMIEIWVMWRWSNPKAGKYYFEDIDRLMDLAIKYDIKVNMSPKYDSVPAWIFNQFPESRLETIYGRYVGPVEFAARQIGGVGGGCINHRKSMEIRMEFLAETVKRYRGHKALYIWNSWGEPDLGHSIHRVVGKDYRNIEFLLCYCESCRTAFKEWLKKKYKGLSGLNKCWHKNYQNWEEIEIPRSRDMFVSMIDWRMFFIERMAEVNLEQMQLIRKLDKRHLVMCHTHDMKYFDLMSTGVDLWRMAEPGDVHGVTLVNDPFACDILRCCAKHKPVWSVEIHAMPGMTMVFPRVLKDGEIKRTVFTPLAAGFSGFQYWQYRPETLGRESPAWGLTKLDGTSTPWLETASRCCKLLQKNKDKVLSLKRLKTDIAILFSPENQIFSWCSYGTEYFYHDSMVGLHNALYQANFNVDILHTLEINKGELNNYSVLYVPVPMYLDEQSLAIIKEWVRNGGTLIGESYFAALDTKDGSFRYKIPGAGFIEVFGVEQGLVRARRDFSGERATIIMDRDLSDIKKGEKINGMLCEETFILKGAKVLAIFKEGKEPAITFSNYGKGKAILIGSFIGYDYFKFRNETNERLIVSLAKIGSICKFPKINGKSKVRLDLISNNKKDEGWVIVTNLEKRRITTGFHLPIAGFSEMEDLFNGKKVRLTSEKYGLKGEISLLPEEIRVFDLLK
ncbi:beta-galactosidase [bacterium]|nr:beta-galactosidase [bacterium]MBU1852851.1 beta-galactosidase [Candidatus Omnitrophota bacterium]